MSTKTERIFQITAPHFVAGFVVLNGKVIETAPIVRYMIGWNGTTFRLYCSKKGWSYQELLPRA